MKKTSTFFLLLLSMGLRAQTPENAPDTLLQHSFEGILDPADTMLNQPTGDDLHWVNYDQDNKIGNCVLNGITPKGWYWESDLGFIDPNAANNYAFTSCSFLQSTNPQNRNWLITAPVYIPDDSYWLCWRSLSYYGPDYMDGYKVLVSTSTNLVTGFTDTVFVAAQTLQSFQLGSLNLDDYIFSSGYIHANGFTDEDYFFVDFEGNNPFYHGKLEPHSVSLSQYAGQTIYVAFLHDSYDDFQLQVDDILISNETSSSNTPSNLLYFNILPNPVGDYAFVSWKTEATESGLIRIFHQTGVPVFEKQFSARSEGQVYVETQDFAAGVYYCQLKTARGQSTQCLIKR